jgi:hypothetical protein
MLQLVFGVYVSLLNNRDPEILSPLKSRKTFMFSSMPGTKVTEIDVSHAILLFKLCLIVINLKV